jgi:hypothetical protein
MTRCSTPDPLQLEVPDELPPLEPRAARALLELVEALAAVDVDDDTAEVA